MGVYKALKGSGPNAPGKPQDVAQALISNLPKAAKDLFAEVTIAGGGYVNVRVQDGYLKDRVRCDAVDVHTAEGPPGGWAPGHVCTSMDTG
jgi:hypothetical protein